MLEMIQVIVFWPIIEFKILWWHFYYSIVYQKLILLYFFFIMWYFYSKKNMIKYSLGKYGVLLR